MDATRTEVKPGDVVEYVPASAVAGAPPLVGTVERVLQSGTLVLSDETYLRRHELRELRVRAERRLADLVGSTDPSVAPDEPATVVIAAPAAAPAAGPIFSPVERARRGTHVRRALKDPARRLAIEAARVDAVRAYWHARDNGCSASEGIAVVNGMPDLARQCEISGGISATHLVHWRQKYASRLPAERRSRGTRPRRASAPAIPAYTLPPAAEAVPAGVPVASPAMPAHTLPPAAIEASPVPRPPQAPAAAEPAGADTEDLLYLAERLHAYSLRLLEAGALQQRAVRVLAILDAYPQGDE